ncbi:hypothetical protein QUB80_24640 [Chlorogloeopsis sp. ULAP01]|nr:hypothetical protein [Chlorogloeopsis sp. ULAP01]MDM9383878.1 hypothetical protein [Chlorogloeopsis sp. ULAP01]
MINFLFLGYKVLIFRLYPYGNYLAVNLQTARLAFLLMIGDRSNILNL